MAASSSHIGPLTSLERFIRDIEADKNVLLPEARVDALKVLKCFRYVRENLDILKWAVEQRDKFDPGIYHSKEDFKHKVLRDPEGTSFHINEEFYKDGQDFEIKILQCIQELEGILNRLSDTEKLLFANQFTYDKNTGCMEKRLAGPFKWAGDYFCIFQSARSLENILSECQFMQRYQNKTTLSLLDFADQYCKEKKLTECFYNEKIIPLTREVLKDYLELLYGVEENSKETASSNLKPTSYQELTQGIEIVQGFHKMWQYRFQDEARARKFLQWLHQQQINNIHRASLKQEMLGSSLHYIVRVTPEQYQALKQAENGMQNEIDKIVSLLVQGRDISKENVSAELLNQALVIKDDYNNTPLHWASEKQRGDAFIYLVDKASPEAINQALIIKNKYIRTPLHYAAANQSGDAFIHLVGKASPDAINQALVIKNNHGDTALLVAAEKQSGAAFIRLVDKASPESINQAIVIKNNYGDTPLHWAASKQPGDAFILLVDKASAEAINEALVIKDDYNNTPLHWASQKQRGDAFIHIVDKASPEAINQALIIKNKYSRTPLLYAAANQSGDAFIRLVDKASADAINQALVIKNDYGNTPLLFAAVEQPGDAFILLVDKASAEAINEALVIKNDYNNTPLHWAAYKQPGDAFIRLVDKASADAINQALVVKNSYGNTALLVAAVKQPGDAFIRLIENASQQALSKACLIINTDKNTVLNYLILRGQVASIEKLITKINAEASNFLLHPNQLNNASLRQFSQLIIDNKNINLMKSILASPSANQFVNAMLNRWFEGDSIDETILTELRTHLIHHPEPNNALATAFLMQDPHENKKLYITTQQQYQILLDDINQPDNLAIIWRDGISLSDAQRIRMQNKYSLAAQVIDDLYAAGLLAQGTIVPFALERYHEKINYAEMAESGALVCKIVAEKNRDDFIKQLSKYDYRPALRTKRNPDATHKFFHTTGEIKEHRYQKKQKEFDSAKKQSATSFSPELQNVVFGEHDASRPLIGILADIACYCHISDHAPSPDDLCVNHYYLHRHENTWKLFYVDEKHQPNFIAIDEVPKLKEALQEENREQAVLTAMEDYHFKKYVKAMISYDSGTYERTWVGDLSSVKKYAEKMQGKSFTNFAAFKAWVKAHPTELNEFLIKFKRSMLKGIVIARDTPEARKEAGIYQQKIYSALNLSLPIFIYNNKSQKLDFLPVREIIDANLSLGRSWLLEMDCHLRLDAMKEFLPPPSTNIFSKIKNSVSDGIWEILRKAEKKECSYEEAMNNIQSFIANKQAPFLQPIRHILYAVKMENTLPSVKF